MTERLRGLEDEIKQIQDGIEAYSPIKVDESLDAIKGHVTKVLAGLRQSLAVGDDDIARAKQALAKHLGKVVLTPATQEGRPIYKVTGNVAIPDDSGRCRMQLVARDGLGKRAGVDSA